MKKLILLGVLAIPTMISGQCSTLVEVDNHFRKASIRTAGHLRVDQFLLDEEEQYYSSTYASNLWMGGVDSSLNLRVSAETFGDQNSDYTVGPLNSSGQPFENACQYFDRVWILNGVDLEEVKTAFLQGYLIKESIPKDILEWPAVGNPNFDIGPENGYVLGQDLAPFYDHDGDAKYDPMEGDLPLFHPSLKFENLSQVWSPRLAGFSVYNDLGPGSDWNIGLQMEIRQSVYFFNCEEEEPDLNNSIFTNFTMAYKGSMPIHDFRLGLWEDPDLACYENDFIGCHLESNASYVYNKEAVESNCSSDAPSFHYDYGLVRNTVLLNNDMKAFIGYKDQGINSSNQGPGGPIQFYNLLGSVWGDGTPLTAGGNGYNEESTDTTEFLYPNLPNDPGGWNMIAQEPEAADLRMLTSIAVRSNINPGDVFDVNIGNMILLDKNVHHLEIFDKWVEKVALVRNKHNDMLINPNFMLSCHAIACEENCVWPGNVFPDGRVDLKDFLYLGAYEGSHDPKGPRRLSPGSDWNSYHTREWKNDLGPVNGRHADCNGNGEITQKDYDVIIKNLGKSTSSSTYLPVPSFVDEEEGYRIGFDKSQMTFGQSLKDDFFKMSIRLLNEGQSLEDGFHGICFDLVYDTTLVSFPIFPSPPNANYFSQVAIAHAFYNGYKDPNGGIGLIGDDRVRYVITSKKGQDQFPTGYIVPSALMVLKSNASTSNSNGIDTIEMKIENSFLIDAEGNPLKSLGYFSEQIIVNQLPIVEQVTSHVKEKVRKVNIYPNPAADWLEIETNINRGGKLILTSMAGEVILHKSVGDLKQHRIELNQYQAGIYFLQIFDDKYQPIATKKIMIVP